MAGRAHGEALAAHGERTASLHAFDHAAHLLPSDPTDERPYVALNPVHLARFGHPDATAVLTDALNRLDPTFVRAETALRVDLAIAYAANGDQDEARDHADQRSPARRTGWLSTPTTPYQDPPSDRQRLLKWGRPRQWRGAHG